MAGPNVYTKIIERIFHSKYKSGMKQVDFVREDIESVSRELDVKLPKNLGDLIYTFRYRSGLPQSIRRLASAGEVWVIRPRGKAMYRFDLIADQQIVPNELMAETKIPEATPGIVAMYAFNDEQALLAKVRYNRLIDTFLGLTCYSLQNHLRTFVRGMGQVETDEIYVGVDKKGTHYVVPVQAKGGRDKLNVVQIEQDFEVCASKLPALVCRPVAAQFMKDGAIALFEFETGKEGVRVVGEKHYRLVTPDEVTEADLAAYRERKSD